VLKKIVKHLFTNASNTMMALHQIFEYDGNDITKEAIVGSTIDEEGGKEPRGAKDIFDDKEVMNYLKHDHGRDLRFYNKSRSYCGREFFCFKYFWMV